MTQGAIKSTQLENDARLQVFSFEIDQTVWHLLLADHAKHGDQGGENGHRQQARSRD